MKYSELVNFEPIDSVVQLTDANDTNKAMHLLDTYVISDRMADTINNMIVEQLQFKRNVDNKGLLIVGNYGSGKSHLMSVISTIAEHEGASMHIANKEVAEHAREIEGQFKVIRFEIGSTEMPLREIIINQLEAGLDEMGVDFEFPAADEIVNNKDALREMMAKFEETYADKGLLLVVDELLDYLRGRREQQLALDLGFLREIGEIAEESRFRFIAGIQEMIFDNPRFSFVADSLRRVQQRFEQVHIVKDDISYVISQRLLKKNDQQKALIREHLTKFTSLYNRLSEDMDTYVDLFPIHPAYLTTFERVHGIEKRVALKTITQEVNKIINEDVSYNAPGVISYDSYWSVIENDPSNKTLPDVREVLDKVSTVKSRIQSAFPMKRRMYKDMAIRIMNAMALNRLTTDDIYSPVGLSAAELKDDLFLTVDGQMDFLLDDADPAAFLASSVGVAMKAVMETVSYQYVSVNDTNAQYYLDLKKDIDVGSLINDRAEIIEPSTMDRYYYAVLKNAVTLDDNTYVSGYQIWSYELPWEERHVTRKGYLFFGAPNERSTAQPERDFYIYFLHPFDKFKFTDEKRDDEVFFDLNIEDAKFTEDLKRYAAASELYADAAQAQKQLYKSKVDQYFKRLNKWLFEHFVSAFKVTYMGKTGFIDDFGMFLPQSDSLKELMDYCADEFLNQWFVDKYSDYPSFRGLKNGRITSNNIKELAADALNYLNGRQSAQGKGIISGLVLSDNQGRVTDESVSRSGYAQWITGLLADKGNGQVINNNEMFDDNAIKGVTDRRLSKEFKLEPELVIVLIVALVKTGKAELSVNGVNYNALNFAELVKQPVDSLLSFTYLKQPTGLPVNVVSALFKMYDVTLPNFDETYLVPAIRELHGKLSDAVQSVVLTEQQIKTGFTVGNREVLDAHKQRVDLDSLKQYKVFIETVLRYDTSAKMKNLTITLADVDSQIKNKQLIDDLKKLKNDVDDVNSLVSYVDQAQGVVGYESEWSIKASNKVDELTNALSDGKSFRSEKQALNSLKTAYIDMYFDAHEKHRLNATEEMRKNELQQSATYKQLNLLSRKIMILPAGQLNDWRQEVQELKACYSLTKSDLEINPICKHCQFNLIDMGNNPKLILDEANDKLNGLIEQWTAVLVSNLETEDVKTNRKLLSSDEEAMISAFVAANKLDEILPTNFVEVVNSLFSGLEEVHISIDDIKKALGNGAPVSLDKLENQLKQLLNELTIGKDKDKVRFTYKG